MNTCQYSYWDWMNHDAYDKAREEQRKAKEPGND